MSTIGYTNYTNIDGDWRSGYTRGNRLVMGYSGEITPAAIEGIDCISEPIAYVLEFIFATHNRDDRPDGRLCPSMSIGDVIVLGETAWTVTRDGFERVDLDLRDLITDRTWTEATR